MVQLDAEGSRIDGLDGLDPDEEVRTVVVSVCASILIPLPC